MSAPKLSLRTYLLTWAGLLALTLTTSLVGLVDLGHFTPALAVVFAIAKATLILLFFMHACCDTRLIRVVIAAAVLWILIMISLTVGDYVTRGWLLPFSGK